MENTFLAPTENGDKAFSTSGAACLDLFTRITRSAPMTDYLDAFTKAWAEDKPTAIRILMNMRDVRSGKGEKLIPAVILVYLKMNLPMDVYEDILRKMVEYGYWKDLLRILEIYTRTCLVRNKMHRFETKPIELRLFAEQLINDKKLLDQNENNSTKAAISLCAKWAPSEKTHYDHHPMEFAKNIAMIMGLGQKDYRLLITKLRKHICVLETLMSTQQFDKIDFSKLPSVALMKMKNAFMRDTNSEGKESDARKTLHISYSEYLQKLAEGKTKVNVKGIQPHELVSTYINGGTIDQLVEGQWKALKERVKEVGAFRDVTAIVDVSGSMSGQPMEVAIALGILVAECTEGPFHGQVITFHENPTWHKLHGANLMEQVHCMKSAPWGGSTNIRATFDMILRQAQSAKLTQAEMVKTLFVFTDMQFNGGVTYDWESSFEYAKRTFASAGYQLPKIVCWNLRTSTAKTMPVSQNEEGFAMLSGFSAELLKCILSAQEFTPIAMMRHVLEPYNVPDSLIKCTSILNCPNGPDMTSFEEGVTKSAIKKAFKAKKENDRVTNSDTI